MAKLAFIVAASHSGSTLTAMLLGSHPQATTIGDTAGTILRHDPEYCCSCGRKATECLFWQEVKTRMKSRGFGINVTDFGTRFECPESPFIDRVLHAEHRGFFLEAIRDNILRSSSRWRQRFQAIAARNVALFDTVTELAGADVLIDSSKLPHRVKFLLRIPELDVKVIHLIRDGRGVVHTYLDENGWSVEKSAVEWQRGIRAAERLLARLPRNRWTQVRYEDLCSDPKGELGKLCTFLGLDPSRVNLDFRSAGLHVFGNKMRLASDPAVRLDQQWRTRLTDSQISTVERLVREQLVQYGYIVDEV